MSLRAIFLVTVAVLGAAWVNACCQVSPTAADSSDAVRIVSYNIWFDDDTGAMRYPALLKEIGKLDPDVVCLQECTDLFMDFLGRDSTLGKYHVTRYETDSWYFNVTLTKSSPISSRTIPFESKMGRQCPVVTLPSGSGTMAIANVHLESNLKDTDIRRGQISAILAGMNESPVQIVAGDFNFGTNMPEEQLFSGFSDVGSVDGRSTFEVGVNPFAPKRSWFPPDSIRRLDRFMVRGVERSRLTYRRIGDGSDFRPLSDHYGVLLDIGSTPR